MAEPVDTETQKRLASGDLQGLRLRTEGTHPKGVLVVRPDGTKAFYDQRYMDLLRHRNRGKD